MPSSDLTVTIVGNLTRDPELRTLPSGNTVCDFSVAYTPRTYDRNSQSYKDGEAMYFRCSAWNSGRMTFAENIANSLSKGMRVIVQGTLTQRSYTGNDGQERTSLEIRVTAVGPDLAFATVQVTRSGNGGSGYSGGYNDGNSRGGYNDGGYSGGSSRGGYNGGNSRGGYSGGSSRGGYNTASSSASQPKNDTRRSSGNDDVWGASADDFGGFADQFGSSHDAFGSSGTDSGIAKSNNEKNNDASASRTDRASDNSNTSNDDDYGTADF